MNEEEIKRLREQSKKEMKDIPIEHIAQTQEMAKMTSTITIPLFIAYHELYKENKEAATRFLAVVVISILASASLDIEDTKQDYNNFAKEVRGKIQEMSDLIDR